jgi:hypothetical protein
MKIDKEYMLMIIGGLFLLAYVLERTTNPIKVPLANPYQFLQSEYLRTYPFTTAIIFIRSLALFMTPVWLLSFFGKAHYTKGGFLLVLAGLMQLYAIQELASKVKTIPLEWTLSLSLGGMALLLPTLLFFFKGMINAVNNKTFEAPDPFN